MQKSIIMQKSTIKKGIFMVLPVFSSCNGAGSFVGNHTNITKTTQHKPFDRLDAIYEERAQACGEAYKRISINLDTSLSCTRRLANEILSCPSMDKSEFQKLSQRKKNFVVTLIAKSIVAKRSTIALKSFTFEDLLHLVYMFAEFRFFGKWHDKETLIESALYKITMEMERQALGNLEATRVLNSLKDVANHPSDPITCKGFENALSKYRRASRQ